MFRFASVGVRPCIRAWSVGASLAIAIGVPSESDADVLYGLTSTDLILFDTNNPTAVTAVGPHGVPAGVILFNATYNPVDRRAYATGSRHLGNDVFETSLWQLRLDTGAATQVTVFGNTGQNIEYEALIFVPAESSLVSARRAAGGNTRSVQIGLLNAAGAFSQLSANTRDNDIFVRDACRNLLYSIDVEGDNDAVVIDPRAGTTSAPVGDVPQFLRTATWSITSDTIFGVMENRTELIRLAVGTSFNATTIATLPVSVFAIFARPCAADYDHDACLNSGDFFAFVEAFLQGFPAADFNHDGDVTSQDFFDFIAAFFAGC